MSGLLATSVTGLMAAQTGLAAVQNNIANVNTVGYSRQSVTLASYPESLTGNGYIGQGVNVTNVTRSYDQFITAQVNSSLAAYGASNSYQQLAVQVDNLMADPKMGVAPAMTNFFSAVSGVANDPSSIPSRQVLLANANSVTQSFNALSSQLGDIRTQNNGNIAASVNSINSLAKNIASLNNQISLGLAQSQGIQQPNGLLDQQGALLSQLAAIVSISVVPQKNGASSVFIGNGQALVQDSGAASFAIFPSKSDPNQLGIGIKTATGTIDVTSQMTGGSLGGALNFQNEVLDQTQQKLGLVAAGLAIGVNAIQTQGFDLNGKQGAPLFSGVDVVPVIPSSSNTGNAAITANLDPATLANLSSSDYQLKYVNAGNGVDYTLTDVQNNQVLTLTARPVNPPVPGKFVLTTTQPINGSVTGLPGISLQVDLSGGQNLSVGDQFLIRPTYNVAQSMAFNITDPSQVAAATNIEVDPVTNLPVPKLDTLGQPVTDTLGNPVYVTINGPMPTDNRNALNMANFQNSLSLLGGKASLHDAYGQIVSSVGTLTQAAQLSASAQKTVLTQAQATQTSLSGVNLNEEAANLLLYQQAYQASAQSIAMAKTLFTTLLTAVQ